jgi:flagellar hook assembly protein FlgD
VETVSGVPVATRPRIDRAFPNPFNPMTTIQFSVPKSGPVRVGIMDVHGRHVATLVNESMGSGVYRIRWNGTTGNGADVASGVYYAQIQSRGGSGSGRLVLIK